MQRNAPSTPKPARTASGKRLKVLVVAEGANPEWVSVPLVGWSIARALMELHDVHLVTQVRNREAIERAGLVEGRDFTAIDNEAIARPVYQLSEKLRMGSDRGWTMVTALSSRLSYPVFEKMIWKQFGPAIKAGEYDIVHRVTPLTLTANSSLAPKCAKAGVPFVMGPLNGGVPWPEGFEAERQQEREWLSIFREVYKWSFARKRMIKSSSAIMAGSRFAAAEFPEDARDKISLLPENAVDASRFNLSASQDISGPLRGCFVGRLVPLKGTDMLIEAAEPFVKSGQLVLDFIGDGPMADQLKSMVTQKNMENGVTFHGWIEHGEVQDILAKANLLTFPSIREFGGGVVLEAMALGVVPIVCDYAGPAELVTDGTGFKIPMGSRDKVISGLREILGSILAQPEKLPDISKAARERIATYFTWPRKAEQISEIYDWILRGQGPIPQPVPLATR